MGVGWVHVETLSDNAGKKRAQDRLDPHHVTPIVTQIREASKKLGATLLRSLSSGEIILP